MRSTPGVRVGAQAVGHSNYFVGRLFAYLIGFKDPRYSGTELDLALIRGELDGRINNADTLMIRNADLLAKGALDIHVIMEVPKGLRQSGFDRLPEIEDFVQAERERKLLAMICISRQFGTQSILPPGTPREQVKICGRAWPKCSKIRISQGLQEICRRKADAAVGRGDGTSPQRGAARPRDRRVVQEAKRGWPFAGTLA